MYTDMAIFSGRAHPELARSVCANLEMPLGACDIFEFSNENIFVRIQENVRQRDVFLIQSLCSPVNTSVMELLIMIDAFRRASAGRITAVIPYFAYGRSDKKDQPRVPITARLLANLIETAGAERVLTMDLHASQIQGFFNIPVDELTALDQIVALLPYARPLQHYCPCDGRRRREAGAQRGETPGHAPGDRAQGAHRQRGAGERPEPDRRSRGPQRPDHR